MIFTLANKSDKKAILRFYKSQHYSASFLGGDSCYLLKENEQIIASVIISTIEKNITYHFLHALVVHSCHQNKGIATALLKYVLFFHPHTLCFADRAMANFYQKSAMWPESKRAELLLPEHLKLRLAAYRKKHPQLQVFRHQ